MKTVSKQSLQKQSFPSFSVKFLLGHAMYYLGK